MSNSMELVVSELVEQQQITFNYEELKKEVTERAEKYKSLVYTEDTIKDAKEDRALLNKVIKAINDEKKRVKEKLLEPYTDFETKCKELMGIVEEAADNIDKQVKSFEESEKQEKMVQILMYWSENSGEYGAIIDTEKLIKKEWLNKSYSMTKIQQEITHIVNKARTDMETINSAIKDENLNKQAKVTYFENINEPTNLSIAIQSVNRVKEQTEKLDSIEKKEEVIQLTETNEEILQFDFRVWATKTQLKELNEYLKSKNIKVGKVK